MRHCSNGNVPSRILCCDLCSLISVNSVLGTGTNCNHYNHKERQPGKTAGMLASGTGNQTGEVIRKNGEKIKGTCCIYRGKVGCRMEGKELILKKTIEKLSGVQPAFKSSMIQCCEKEKCTTENFFK